MVAYLYRKIGVSDIVVHCYKDGYKILYFPSRMVFVVTYKGNMLYEESDGRIFELSPDGYDIATKYQNIDDAKELINKHKR